MLPLNTILVLLCATLITVPICRRLGLTSTSGYLIAGIVVGPFILGLLTHHEASEVRNVGEFGVVLLLFATGLSVNTRTIWRQRWRVLSTGAVQTVLAAAPVVTFAWFALGLSIKSALLAGLLISFSQALITTQILRERKLAGTPGADAANNVVVFQQPFAALLLVLLPVFGASSAETTFDWRAGAIAIVTVIGAVLVGHFALKPLVRLVNPTKHGELITTTALAIILSAVVLTQSVGISAATGALIAGLVLSSSEFRYEIEAAIEPFKGILVGLYFMMLGATLDLSKVQPLLALGLAATILLGRLLLSSIHGWLQGLRRGDLRTFVVAQLTVGELSFAAVPAAVMAAVIDSSLSQTMIAAAAITLFAVPVTYLLGGEASRKLRVFVSYSRKDVSEAQAVVLMLESAAMEVKLDTRDLPFGEEWQRELSYFINQADAVVWLVSPASISSAWCQWEVNEVTQLKKKLLPVVVAPVDPAILPAAIGKIHLLPASGTFDPNNQAHSVALVEALNADRAWLKEYTRISERARTWDDGGRSVDWLLRGKELLAAEFWSSNQPSSVSTLAPQVLDLIHASRLAQEKSLVAV